MPLLNDFTAVARTVAVPSEKLGLSECCGGFSVSQNKLIRIYPLPTENVVRQWGTYRVLVDRRKGDNREESWKLDESFAPHRTDSWQKPSPKIRYGYIAWLLANHLCPSTQWLNDERKSLGVIIPTAITGCEFAKRDVRIESYGANATAEMPYLHYTDAGGRHRQQVREIGCYEWLRKNRGNPWGMWKNKRLDDDDYRHILFVGNNCHHRNVWLIIDLIQVNMRLLRKHAPLLPISGLENQTGFSHCKGRGTVRICP